MDKIDLKIINQLDENPRKPTSHIAKEARVSQQVVDYRIKRLQESKIIHFFSTVINPFALGYRLYVVGLSFKQLNPQVKKELIRYFDLDESIMWAALTGGEFDVCLLISTKSHERLDSFLDVLFDKFDVFGDYQIFPLVKLIHHPYNYLDSKNDEFTHIIKETQTVNVDDLDMKILHQVKQNARESYLQIGNTVGVSYQTVKHRLQALHKKGVVLGSKLFIHPQQLNYESFVVMLSLSTFSKKDDLSFFQYILQHKNITTVMKVIGGKWTYMLTVDCKDREQLHEIMIDVKNKYPVMDEFEILTVFNDVEMDHYPRSVKDILSK